MRRLSLGTLALVATMLTAPGARADAFSYLNLDAGHLHLNTQGSGHGGSLAFADALSDNAFLYGAVAQYGYDAFEARRYDFGVGINSTASAGYSVFATAGWNHISLSPRSGGVPTNTAFTPLPGSAGAQDHGYGASLGIRAWFTPRWELYGLMRVEHNHELANPVNSEFGLLYALSPHWSAGAAVTVYPKESDYLLSLRWYY